MRGVVGPRLIWMRQCLSTNDMLWCSRLLRLVPIKVAWDSVVDVCVILTVSATSIHAPILIMYDHQRVNRRFLVMTGWVLHFVFLTHYLRWHLGWKDCQAFGWQGRHWRHPDTGSSNIGYGALSSEVSISVAAKATWRG